MKSMAWAGVVVAVISSGCTSPNPRSCQDGLCTDQAYPFCDVDGSFAGSPETCIAVACTPGEFASCRGDVAVRCNDAGNDYDLVQCELACEVATGGCSSCSDSTQCANPSPVCDTTSKECRGCSANDECASQLCNMTDGTCVPESAVVSVSPMGTTTAPCTLAEPCALARGVTVAAAAGVTPTLRMLPGLYAQPLRVEVAPSQKLVVLATGASLGPMSGLLVTAGAKVELRGLTITANAQGGGLDLRCGSPIAATPISELTILDSTISMQTTGPSLQADRCNVRIERSVVEGTGGYAVYLTSDSGLVADRVAFRAKTAPHPMTANGSRISVTVTNSVFDDVYPALTTSDSGGTGSQLLYAFNTIVMRATDGMLVCTDPSGPHNFTTKFENNIIYSTGASPAVFGNVCTLTNNVIFPQTTVRPNNINLDPQLVNMTTRDYRLTSISPAINVAVPSNGLDPDHDYAGTLRPQGAAKDIGAFELVP